MSLTCVMNSKETPVSEVSRWVDRVVAVPSVANFNEPGPVSRMLLLSHQRGKSQ